MSCHLYQLEYITPESIIFWNIYFLKQIMFINVFPFLLIFQISIVFYFPGFCFILLQCFLSSVIICRLYFDPIFSLWLFTQASSSIGIFWGLVQVHLIWASALRASLHGGWLVSHWWTRKVNMTVAQDRYTGQVYRTGAQDRCIGQAYRRCEYHRWTGHVQRTGS